MNNSIAYKQNKGKPEVNNVFEFVMHIISSSTEQRTGGRRYAGTDNCFHSKYFMKATSLVLDVEQLAWHRDTLGWL